MKLGIELLCYCRLQDYKRAFDAYHKAVLLNDKNIEYWFSIALLYVETGQFRDALSSVTRAVRLDQNAPPKAWFITGLIYESAGQFEDALSAFDKAIQIDPNNLVYRDRVRLTKNKMK